MEKKNNLCMRLFLKKEIHIVNSTTLNDSVNCYRCGREPGGHPSQQNVHLSPLLECSWNTSIQNERKLSQTLCYLLLNRSEKSCFSAFPARKNFPLSNKRKSSEG